MQILKAENNRRILEAALREFEQYGYQQSSMRRIAATAGMTTGNIYRYYSNKEALFQELIGPVYLQFTNFFLIIQNKLDDLLISTSEHPEHYEFMDLTFKQLVLFIEESRIEAKILLNRSEGSIYELAKNELTDLVIRIFESISSMDQTELDPTRNVAIRVFAATLIEGVCIAVQTVSEPEQIRYIIQKLAYTIAKGL
ncbi:helix-turn-helix domain-containing protein [Paenibacillus illinoisensis]|uniref:TetR/AcrR family transcriptional regulator n=1 Tax=Paenibacillus illinoisensis TaxID=59845 RepID=UPI003CE7ECC2